MGLTATMGPSTWQYSIFHRRENLTLLNGWAPFSSPWGAPAIYMDNIGSVWLSGLVAGGTANTQIAIIPYEYRIAAPMIFPALDSNGASEADANIFYGGTANPVLTHLSGVGNAYLNLNQCRWKLDL